MEAAAAAALAREALDLAPSLYIWKFGQGKIGLVIIYRHMQGYFGGNFRHSFVVTALYTWKRLLLLFLHMVF